MSVLVTRARASALLFGGVASCLVPTASRAQNSGTLRLGITPIEGAAEAFYAKEMGFFAKAGLDVDVQPMQPAPVIAAAVTSNAIDIGYSTLDTLARAHQKNIPLVVIAPAAEYLSSTWPRHRRSLSFPRTTAFAKRGISTEKSWLPMRCTVLRRRLRGNGSIKMAEIHLPLNFWRFRSPRCWRPLTQAELMRLISPNHFLACRKRTIACSRIC